MNSLHILTRLKFHRTIPDYDDIVESKHKLMTMIDARHPIEMELRELETFRRTLMTLVEEALAQMSAAPHLEPPFLSVQLESGEDFDDLIRDHSMSLCHERETGPLWTLRLHVQHVDHQIFSFDSMEEAVRHMSSVLTAWTSAWFSELDFQDSRVDP
jgi:hypothetical protein